MFSSLMTTRRFAPLFWCQFFSAFNDNFLKQSLVILIIFKLASEGSGALVQLAAAVFIFPYFILSALGGQMADRYDKAVVAKRLKFAEILVAGIAVVGLLLRVHSIEYSIVTLFVALFGFGVIGALFGPIKYGILPDHLAESELPAGNALVEAATFLAILVGTVAGGYAAKSDPGLFGGLMMVFAVLCWFFARLIPRTGEGAPQLVIERNIATSTLELLRDLKSEPRLWWGGLVSSWFWLIGSVALALLGPVVKDMLGGNENAVSAYLAVFAIAVALGSGLASWLCHGRIVLVPTLIGGLLLGIFALDLGWTLHGVVPAATAQGIGDVFRHPPAIHVALDLMGLAIGGGLFIVPTFSAVQAWAGADRRARVIAAVNVLNAAFMSVAAVTVALLEKFAGMGPASVFLLLGVLNFVVVFLIARTLPTNLLRDFLTVAFRSIFRLEVTGLENVAKGGPNAIIALNHVSFLDASLALSFLDTEPVFAIDSGIAQRWWAKPFLRFTRALPLDPTKPMATRTLIQAVQGGQSLIIFPEGRITVTGSLMKVYDGAGLIAEKSGAMVVPVRIEGLEATFFSRLGRHQVRRRLFPKVKATVLPPVRLEVDPALRGKKRRIAAGAALYQVMSDLVFRTTSTDRSVIEAVVDAAKEHGRSRVAVEDPVTGALSYRKLLAGASVLGRKLIPLTEPGEAVGVMLPNANGAAATILALMSAGRIPAMINFTSGPTNVRNACRAARIRTILTSRNFIEKGRLAPLISQIESQAGSPADPSPRIVYLEDIRTTISLRDRLRGLFTYGRPLVKRAADDPAAILFTSGSEGTPKGVVLSNRNILTNAAQAEARIDFGRTDKVFSVLPVFHSFGLTVGLILPLVSGVPIYLYPSPLHYRIVPELIYGTNATIMFGTDTFLAGYARSAHAYDFRSLRYILAGAEPVKVSTRRVYMEKFGLRILEGYGVTETSPVLALNTPMFNKFGTVGRLLPGMEARLEPVEGVDDGGRLFVRGPNVMLGYLRAENPGVLEPPKDGWYDTGDIVSIDHEGFITIRGRAKRFAKIGGEMISLAAVETLAAELWPDAISGVATVPDPRKGERLILVTTHKNPVRADLLLFARSRGASEMMVPSEVLIVEKLPLLGSGKIDYTGLQSLVNERVKLEGAAAS
ncbi:MAG TPA: acyl-[ACP]--phospholipid O-acyltransferase [Xanthobacteraceae bacterium]|nr:acyl-[ACP]--phospholipid O-acyltransferase [Xanthobacteraceae bacterium]